MNDQQPPQEPNLPDGFEDTSSAAYREMPVEQPRASLILRQDSVRDERVASMDAANRSLADALRITYRLIQGVLVVLVVLFLFSGLRQIDQSEIGIKVSFGRITDRNLQPGAHLSLPFPLGEVIPVSTAQRVLRFQDSFTHGQFNPASRLENQQFTPGSLNPELDGMLLTADTNLAHATFSVAYRRSRPAEYLEELYTPHEEDLIRLIAERAVVHTVAGVTIDELLQRASSGPQVLEAEPSGEEIDGEPVSPQQRESSIEQLVRLRMQSALDELQVGIEIDQAALQQVFAPLTIREDFVRVNQVDAQATQARQRAEQERRSGLNSVAGSAYEVLLDLIDEYGLLLEAGDKEDARRILAVIQSIFRGELQGQRLEIEGKEYSDVRLAGQAASVLSGARRYRQTVVSEARRRADTFETKLALYHSNPALFLLTEYREAMAIFRSYDHVQAFMMPPDAKIEILVNNDPQSARERSAAERERASREVLRQRERALGVGR